MQELVDQFKCFSTITSAGGGGGGAKDNINGPQSGGNPGGSGGGSRVMKCRCWTNQPGGAGNTPSVSPPQGNGWRTSPGQVLFWYPSSLMVQVVVEQLQEVQQLEVGGRCTT